MYQIKERLLKRPDITASASPSSPTLQSCDRLETIARKTSYAVKQSPARATRERLAIDRQRFLTTHGLSTTTHLDYIGPTLSFSQCSIGETTLEAFFGEPLRIGIERAIPDGTPDARRSQGDPMDGSYIDTVAGASELTLSALSPQVTYFIANSRALSTRNLYRWGWSRVLRICRDLDVCPMPLSVSAATCVLVQCVNDGLAYGSLRTIGAVIAAAHKVAGQPDPTKTVPYRALMRGIRRTIGDEPSRKEAITVDELRLIRNAASIHNHPWGVRDWAMIAIGFAGAMRRSEIVSRNVADCEFHDDHLRIWLDRSKSDQNRQGVWIVIQRAQDQELCPIEALKAWIDLLPGPGPLFRPITRHGHIVPKRLAANAVSETVKAYGIVLDLPEDRLGAHSLRAGMITAMIDGGVQINQTMHHSRHKQSETVQKYYRPRNLGPNMTKAAGL